MGSTFAAVLVGGCLMGTILYTHFTGWPLMGETAEISPLPYTELTDGLLNQYVIAFEAMAMLLLAALVAAIMTATEPEKAENSEQGRVA